MTEMPATPPNPSVPPPSGERPGELLDRFLARLVDGIIMGVVFFVLSQILAGLLIQEATVDLQTGTLDAGSAVAYSIVLGLVFAVLNLGYYAFMESSRGQTVGKMVLKLEVRGPSGGRPTLEQAVRRNIWNAWPLGYVIPVLGILLTALALLVAEIMIAVGIHQDTARRQAWHDRFAGGTYVVKAG